MKEPNEVKGGSGISHCRYETFRDKEDGYIKAVLELGASRQRRPRRSVASFRHRWSPENRVTAIVVVRFDQAVYVATDGLTYTLGGRTALASKVYTAPHMPLALAARGPLGVAHVVGTTLALMFPTFDDVVAGLEAEFPAIHKTYALSTGRPISPTLRAPSLCWPVGRRVDRGLRPTSPRRASGG
jgi:hypothetical protein